MATSSMSLSLASGPTLIGGYAITKIDLGIGILYWSIHCILLATVPYLFELDTSAWWTPDAWWIFVLHAPGLLRELIPFSFILGTCMPVDPCSQTIKNSIAPWTELEHIDGRLRFHIVLDADTELAWSDELPPFVSVDQVPQSFRPRHALYKARALEFFRRIVHLEEDDWVLHLDEETQLDSYAIKAVLDFIERGDEHIGMGTVLFNTGVYWRNPFLTAAEMYRTVADWGQFRLPVRLCQRPLSGYIHGAFILVNGGVENAVTWDTSCVSEDFWFGLQVGDRLSHSASGDFRESDFVLHINQAVRLGAKFGPLILPLWILQWTAFDMAQTLFSTGSSSIIQDLDAGGIGKGAMVLHALFSWVFLPVYSLCEGLVKAYAILYPPKGFHVIKKV
ncbi:MAG: hypothetical protein Q9208_007763 [Pyrenodesmia sp. 3 TL-2023]